MTTSRLVAAQPPGDKLKAGRLLIGAGRDGQPLRGQADALTQVEVHLAADQRLHQPQRAAALGEGVLGAAGGQPGREQPAE